MSLLPFSKDSNFLSNHDDSVDKAGRQFRTRSPESHTAQKKGRRTDITETSIENSVDNENSLCSNSQFADINPQDSLAGIGSQSSFICRLGVMSVDNDDATADSMVSSDIIRRNSYPMNKQNLQQMSIESPQRNIFLDNSSMLNKKKAVPLKISISSIQDYNKYLIEFHEECRLGKGTFAEVIPSFPAFLLP